MCCQNHVLIDWWNLIHHMISKAWLEMALVGLLEPRKYLKAISKYWTFLTNVLCEQLRPSTNLCSSYLFVTRSIMMDPIIEFLTQSEVCRTLSLVTAVSWSSLCFHNIVHCCLRTIHVIDIIQQISLQLTPHCAVAIPTACKARHRGVAGNKIQM